MTVATDLPSPFGQLGVFLSDAELRQTAYEIFVAACRANGGKPLTYTPQSDRTVDRSLPPSLTSAAASKMKKAFGIRSPTKKGSLGQESIPVKSSKKPASVGELMRVQMGISEQLDARIRRGLLRIAAGNLGKRMESMVLPLEFLQQFKASDFPDQQEYKDWQARNLKVLEAGLLLHPLLPLDKSDAASQKLHQIMHGASDGPIETGKNSESMQILRSAVTSLAYRLLDGIGSDACHWADGFPLNLHLYQMLLEACFNNSSEEGSTVDEFDEVLELIKKTWAILGINQMFHNLCFTWTLFLRFVTTGEVEVGLLIAADAQLTEVASDAKATQDPTYSKILSSTLSYIMDWTEKKLFAYHDMFNSSNIELMETVVSFGVTAAKILVEDFSTEYHRKRREETDVARSRIDAYIRSSLRAAFAQKMKQTASSKLSSEDQSTPLLSILAEEIEELANKEKELFSPILKKWHPLAAGVAVMTLHSCYGTELKQFLSGVKELAPDVLQVLRAADKLEKDLLDIVVEDSVDSDDGGKSLIREMPPYEAESAIADLVRAWIKSRLDQLKEWLDRTLQQEVWNPRANKENRSPSSVEILRMVDETLDEYFDLPIPMHAVLLPDLLKGLDRSLQHYASEAQSGCGARNDFMPALPELTRCTVSSKLRKKKDKPQNSTKRRSQVGLTIGDCSLGLSQFCVRINSLYHIHKMLENLEKKIKSCLRNLESAQEDVSNGTQSSFELSLAACQEGIPQLCETTAYRMIFHDLDHVLWNSLYVGEAASSRIDPFLKELDLILEVVLNTVHMRVRHQLITELMKASFDGLLLVLLAGGPSRGFSCQDSQIIEEDFKSLRELYLADRDGLPEELFDKAAAEVNKVLPLFRTDTETLIEKFKHMIAETYDPAAKSKYPIPPNPGNWGPTEPSTILHVLCHRNDVAATKFLKRTYNFPKKL
ncbi:protein unc-13 homolog [Musa acuminata AAA Group]|uniref:protein unc-13 homolog n=1 Tax=Musa acuminata AAA Group TaxID=214697 RepID=UPI0008A0AFAF|nr:PREDICTED: uncharacterized protein LOC103981520 [Musa acuminata subsp. malaccensis]